MKTIACRNAAGLLGPVMLFLILTGCATTPEYEFDRSADFSKYRTFALMPLPTQSPLRGQGIGPEETVPLGQRDPSEDA